MVDTRDHFGVHIVQMAKQNSTLMYVICVSQRYIDLRLTNAVIQECHPSVVCSSA